MKKRYIALLLAILGIGFFIYTKMFWIPFNVDRVENNQYKYEQNGFIFISKDRLTNLLFPKDALEADMLKGKGYSVDLTYSMKGVPSLKEILAKKHISKYTLIEHLGKRADSIDWNSITPIIIGTLTNNRDSVDYSYQVLVGSDTVLVPIEINSTLKKWLKEFEFTVDSVDNCFRRIAYTNQHSIIQVQCYLEYNNDSIYKHGLIHIEKRGNSDVKLEDLLKIAKSFRIVDYSKSLEFESE